MYKMSHLSCCRHHQTHGGLCSKLLLLKAQAVAMIGDLQAAIDIVTEWQQTFRDSSSSATVSSEADDASSWQKAWQEAAEAKDAGNDLFRRGDFTGDCHIAVYNNMIMHIMLCKALLLLSGLHEMARFSTTMHGLVCNLLKVINHAWLPVCRLS